MKIGIIWLPNVGKSTLFNALTKSYSAAAANFPFCTIEPNVGIVDVKDIRLDTLSDIMKTKKTIYSAIKFVDIAGLVKGASQGEGFKEEKTSTSLKYVREDGEVHPFKRGEWFLESPFASQINLTGATSMNAATTAGSGAAW